MSFITLIFLCLSFGLASITLWLIIIYQVFKIRPLFALFCIVFPVSVIYFGFRFPVQIKKVVFFLTLSIVGFFSTGLAYQKGWYESIDPFLEERKKLEELTFEIDVGNLPQLRIEETDALFRYMAGSFRWDMKVIDGRYVAIRKKIEQDDSNDSENQRSSTSILVSFSEGPNYYGIDFGQITTVNLVPGKNAIKTRASSRSGFGLETSLVLKTPTITIEIFEASKDRNRNFTKTFLLEFQKELTEVQKNKDHLARFGLLKDLKLYQHANRYAELDSSIEIKQVKQPGIYQVTAWVRPEEMMELYLKVFDVKTGEQLSEDKIFNDSLRLCGWSELKNQLFPYQTEIIIYEGDWDHQYLARFELWGISVETKTHRKLIEKSELIYGWQM